MSSDGDDNYNSNSEAESELDDVKHNELIENVLNLSKKPILKKPTRTEPTLQISEFNLIKSSTGKKGDVQLKDLTKSLKKTSKYVNLGQQVEAIGLKSKPLTKPLEKPQAERIRRTIAYEETKKQLNRWDPIVTSNRASGTLRFPLKHDELKIDFNAKPEEYFKWTKSKLQLDIEKVTIPIVETIEVNTDEQEFPLTMEEMMEKRKQSAKLRAFQSYKEAKARRQNKIKSKKFHKIERKAKAKQQLKDFEVLQKINPEAALEKLEELEKARAEERISLRHKNTGQWAKNKQIRAKYDKESRQVLAEQLAISRDLTQKLKKADSDLEDDENDCKDDKSFIPVDTDNPWTGNSKIKPNTEVINFLNNFKSFSSGPNKMSKNTKEKSKTDIADPETFVATISKNEVQLKKGNKKKEKKLCSNMKDQNRSKVDLKHGSKSLRPESKSSAKKRKQLDSVTDSDCINKSQTKPKKRKTADASKEVHLEESAGSLWLVSTLAGDKMSTNNGVDEIFDDLGRNLKTKVQRKLEHLKKPNVKVTPHKKLKAKQSERKVKKVKSNFDMLELKQERRRLRRDGGLNEGDEIDDQDQIADLKRLEDILEKAQSAKKTEEIDPNKFINMKPVKLNTELPDVLVNQGEENDESDEESTLNKVQKEVISEAFCDDDIVDDFHRDKQNEINKNAPKAVNLTMPGWGSWGGKNLKVPKWKRRRFILKAPKPEVRKDSNRGNLIINEDENNAKVARHMVSDVPFPYKDVKEFETSLKTPIDGTFIPQTAFRKFIEPPVITKMGTIIEPMTEDILLKTKKSTIR